MEGRQGAVSTWNRQGFSKPRVLASDRHNPGSSAGSARQQASAGQASRAAFGSETENPAELTG